MFQAQIGSSSGHETYNTSNKEELLKGADDSVASPLGDINPTVHETPYCIFSQDSVTVSNLQNEKEKRIKSWLHVSL